MKTSLKIVTPPANLPVDVDFVARHCRLDQDWDEELLTTYIQSATEIVQNYCNRVLINTQMLYAWENSVPPVSWPMVLGPSYILPIGLDFIFRHNRHQKIELPRAPVQSIDSITIGNFGFDDNGTAFAPFIAVEGVDYVVSTVTEPPAIRLKNWQVFWEQDYVQILFTAGFGADPNLIPKPIIHAVAMVTANMYEHRNDENASKREAGEGEMIGMTPAVQNLLANYRMYSFDGL